MGRFSLIFFTALTLFLFFSDPVQAAILPRFRKSSGKSGGVVSSGVGISARLRGDRKALNLYLSNLSKAKSVTYTLIYQTNGKDEGVSGSVDSSAGNNTSRELLFGTCSSGVCRYHQNLSSMKVEVITELLNGRKTMRRFRVRV